MCSPRRGTACCSWSAASSCAAPTSRSTTCAAPACGPGSSARSICRRRATRGSSATTPWFARPSRSGTETRSRSAAGRACTARRRGGSAPRTSAWARPTASPSPTGRSAMRTSSPTTTGSSGRWASAGRTRRAPTTARAGVATRCRRCRRTPPSRCSRAAPATLGLATGAVPLLINSVPYGGRPACVRCGTCVGFACHADAKNGTHNTTIVRAVAAGRCDLLTGTAAMRLVTEGRAVVGCGARARRPPPRGAGAPRRRRRGCDRVRPAAPRQRRGHRARPGRALPAGARIRRRGRRVRRVRAGLRGARPVDRDHGPPPPQRRHPGRRHPRERVRADADRGVRKAPRAGLVRWGQTSTRCGRRTPGASSSSGRSRRCRRPPRGSRSSRRSATPTACPRSVCSPVRRRSNDERAAVFLADRAEQWLRASGAAADRARAVRAADRTERGAAPGRHLPHGHAIRGRP